MSIWAGVFLFLVVAVVFGIIGVATGFIIGPRRTTPLKEEVYECGMPTQGPTWVQFKANYFLYAVLFVIFDVLTIYLYAWAVKFQTMGFFIFIEMLIFVSILSVGLWFAWKEGALEWQ